VLERLDHALASMQPSTASVPLKPNTAWDRVRRLPPGRSSGIKALLSSPEGPTHSQRGVGVANGVRVWNTSGGTGEQPGST
jgi:hypothetical protein